MRFEMRIIIALALVLALVGCSKSHDHSAEAGRPAAASVKQRYHCPMHPTYVSDKPGDCPICNMALVPMEQDEHEAAVAFAGRVAIKLSPEKQQLIGLTTAPVEMRELQPSIRTVGRVDYAEPNVAWINTKIMGWIEKLHVDATGQYVKKGDPLLEIYSPDLVTAQREYLVAGESTKESARRRLELWDITENQIQELESTGKPRKTLVIASPMDGYVVEKTALAGKSVMPGENLYRIADLTRVWIYADVYEYEMAHVKAGQQAYVTASYAGARPVIGKVSYIYPYLEAQTRTVKVRIESPNPNLRLKPEMYVDVGIELAGDKVLAIPASAVIDTGARQIAFVDAGEGRLEPRELHIGTRTDDYFEVISGVAEGERVVTRALFLVDSESQLKAAIAGMGAAGAHQH